MTTAVHAALGRVWEWFEVNGWTAVATAFVVMLTWTHLAEPMLRRARSLARQPTASRAVDLAERQRLARERQAKAFQRASEKNAIRARERRAREAEELAALGSRVHGRGRRLGSGDDADSSPRPNRKPKPEDDKDDPFRRLRERNRWLPAPRAGTNRRNGWSTREAEDGKRPSTESSVKTLEGRSRLRFPATTP